MSKKNIKSMSRRSVLKGAMSAAALTLPSSTAVAKYRQDRQGDSGIGNVIKNNLRNHNYQKAQAAAKKYDVPFSSSMVQVNPSESQDGGAIPDTQRSIRNGQYRSEDDMSTQDILNPPGGPDSSYMGMGGYCVRGGDAIGLTLSWMYEVRPVEEWDGALDKPNDGVSITYNPDELQMVPNSAQGFEFSSGKDTSTTGVLFEVNDKKQNSQPKDTVSGSISVEVRHNGNEQPAPVAYGDYMHTWKQARDIITQFNFNIGIGVLDVQGSRVPRNWSSQTEMSAHKC